MPTAAINQFWLAGWGPANSLVVSDVPLVGLKDPGFALVGLKDRVPVLVGSVPPALARAGKSAQVTGLVGLKDEELEYIAGHD